jgi:hypothetical protein
MAIRKRITVNVPIAGDIEIDAYVRVAQITGNADNMNVIIQSLRDDAAMELVRTDSVSFVPDLSGANFFEQAYAAVKAMPMFLGATDC